MSSTSLVFWSVPTFWLGLILLMIFGGTLQWLPTGGMITPGLDPWSFAGIVDVIKHLILPVIIAWSPSCTRSSSWSCAPPSSRR